MHSNFEFLNQIQIFSSHTNALFLIFCTKFLKFSNCLRWNGGGKNYQKERKGGKKGGKDREKLLKEEMGTRKMFNFPSKYEKNCLIAIYLKGSF